jgi:hypothetical protein
VTRKTRAIELQLTEDAFNGTLMLWPSDEPLRYWRNIQYPDGGVEMVPTGHHDFEQDAEIFVPADRLAEWRELHRP